MTTPDQQATPFQFAVAATFTADPLRPFIEFWSGPLHAEFEVRFAPYNQVMQSLLDPTSILSRNTHGANIVLLRLEDIGTDADQAHANLRHVAEQLRESPARLAVPLIVCLCPSHTDWAAAEYASAERLLEAALDEIPGAQFIRCSAVQQCYAVQDVHSPEGERLGRIPYTEAWFCALATMLVRHTHALFRAPYKLIALDCDNTLWRGICGEDGPQNVFADPPRRALQEFMLAQREEGALLALASKNNEADVFETFRLHPEMPLHLRHFVTWRLNWESKAGNLLSIADQLGLSPDSFIFIDDSPKECAELQDALPEVLTLALPENVVQIPHFLDHVWAFDRPVVTEEDRNRSAYYAQVAEFGNEVRRARTLEEFMSTLGLNVRIVPVTPERLPRVAQLTQRTNQFNTTTIRRNESDIQSLLNAGAQVLTVDVSDRFGDYGLVGVMVVRADENAFILDSMLLSCRALGRGVEHRMLADLGQRALQAGKSHVLIPFQRTARNQPALQFVEHLSTGEQINHSSDGFELRIASDAASRVQWTPGSQDTNETPKLRKRGNAPKHGVDYGRIARELSTVPQIFAAIRSTTAAGFDPSMSETERRLASIWADLLGRPGISRNDNFFDLGGHSLAAVLLLIRIREAFDIELSIDDVYSGGLTLAALAERIETVQTGDIYPEEYAALVAEIEALTDEEARELLARENGLA